MKRIITYFILLSLLPLFAFSQVQDTSKAVLSKKEIYHRARMASLMSAIVPGAGQFYNHKYWKPPIIYAGLAGFGYMFITYRNEFKGYSNDLRALNDNDPSTNTPNSLKYNSDQLLGLKTDARKYRDIGLIGFSILYLVNIVDANVDAHLKSFDVSDDLSLNVRPYSTFGRTGLHTMGFQNGICIQLKFK